MNLLLSQLNYQLDANYLASLRTSFLSLVLLSASTSIKKWLRLLITSRRHSKSSCWKKLLVLFGVCLLMRFTCPEWLIGSLITRLFESLTRRPRVKILIWYARALIWLIVARWVTRGKLSELLTLNESIEVMNGNPLESFLWAIAAGPSTQDVIDYFCFMPTRRRRTTASLATLEHFIWSEKLHRVTQKFQRKSLQFVWRSTAMAMLLDTNCVPFDIREGSLLGSLDHYA